MKPRYEWLWPVFLVGSVLVGGYIGVNQPQFSAAWWVGLAIMALPFGVIAWMNRTRHE